MGSSPIEPGEIFPKIDPLFNITAADVGPEIAAAPGLAPSTASAEESPEPEP